MATDFEIPEDQHIVPITNEQRHPKWAGYFKIVKPTPELAKQTDSQALGDQGSYGNYTWYQRLIQGSASRLTRYREYDLMDNDVSVARALDTIAEEMTGNNPKSNEPIELEVVTLPGTNDGPRGVEILTLRTALRRWGYIHDFENKLFKIARTLSKYGDCFFKKKEPFGKWEFIHPKNVVAAIVDREDVTKVLYWQIKKDIKESKTSYGTPVTGNMETETEYIPSHQTVRFTLCDDMEDTAPFGESILRPVYRTHKQKELLEDAVIIYRIQRAPERRVFYIDVGKMPPQRVKMYLEQIKNEIKQKKIPSQLGGQNEVQSVYNPQAMSEDFFFACLSMSSKISLLDGRTLTLDECRQEYEKGKENWVYSVNQKTGRMIPGKIAWAGYTRRNAELVRVHLDNGEYIDCTPDHKFVLRGGSEVEAQYLTPNTSLMPLKEEYTPNHKVVRIEKLPYREDTGCLHVVEPTENHNFALAAGVYVKNSRPDGRGSRVETLPGGQGLGELADLEYFYNKVWEGLRIPQSYMAQGQDGALINDGKVGVAYIQELRFALFIMRLQARIEVTLDEEFKKFLQYANILIDDSFYRLRLPLPTNFGKYRQQELDAQLLTTYGSADGIPYLSKRFAMSRYLQMSEEEIAINERMLREERGMDPDGGEEDYPSIYGAGEGAGGLGGGLGGGFAGGGPLAAPAGMPGLEGGEEGLGGEEAGMGAEGLPGGETTPPPAG